MNYNSKLIFYLVLYLILSGSVVTKPETEDINFTFENITEEYGTYLDNIEQNGEFSISMVLDPISLASVEFYYDIFTDISIVSKSENVVHHEGTNARINGTLEPGDTALIIHRIENCLIDQLPGLIFKFEKNDTNIASLSLEIEILDNGTNNCGSQISGPNIGFQLIYLIIAIVIFIIFWVIVRRKLKPYTDHFEND